MSWTTDFIILEWGKDKIEVGVSFAHQELNGLWACLTWKVWSLTDPSSTCVLTDDRSVSTIIIAAGTPYDCRNNLIKASD